MGKILICFFFLFFFSIQKIDSILVFRRFNISIWNRLSGDKKLMVICRQGKGKATDIVFLPFNVQWTIYFTVYPRTLIWCNIWKGPDYVQHAHFNAFIGKESFIHDVCGGRKPNVCLWQAQEDGVYVRNNAVGTFKLMFKWDTNSSTNILF
ncbi:PREDICTED: uncharacterized protein LOC104760060 [Camelina sativa]|uniref:Uncharacterized protein LOC104760060 n=1 Tax=Camelina sativa TaxID=90675 RepID=A0ABM0X5V3_CAMSA|nr:PREDICTED: uncharacterized protein LOC104760060 [Camelina sativa]